MARPKGEIVFLTVGDAPAKPSRPTDARLVALLRRAAFLASEQERYELQGSLREAADALEAASAPEPFEAKVERAAVAAFVYARRGTASEWHFQHPDKCAEQLTRCAAVLKAAEAV